MPAGVCRSLVASRLSATVIDVRRLLFSISLRDVAVDQPVVGAVEIRLRDEVGDAVPRRVLQQQPAQHRLLRLDRVRRKLDQLDLVVLQRSGRRP